ncbi:hypothetical protein MKX03_013801 [Papaver bracteatum]|nr:hypothetical protein MKX03_013801 [Papaver bracteatum]
MGSSSSSSSPEVSERRGILGASCVSDVQTYLTHSLLDVTSSLAFLQERKTSKRKTVITLRGFCGTSRREWVKIL